MGYITNLAIIFVAIWMARKEALQLIITTVTIVVILAAIVKLVRMIEDYERTLDKLKSAFAMVIVTIFCSLVWMTKTRFPRRT